MFPINIVTRRSPLVKTMILKTTSSQSVVLSRFPNVLITLKIDKLYVMNMIEEEGIIKSSKHVRDNLPESH